MGSVGRRVSEYISGASKAISSSIMLNKTVLGDITSCKTSVPDICTPCILGHGPEMYIGEILHYHWELVTYSIIIPVSVEKKSVELFTNVEYTETCLISLVFNYTNLYITLGN